MRSASAVRREPAFLAMWWFVQGAVSAAPCWRSCASALLLSQGVIDRHGVPALPVRAADRAAARGARARARDGAEGERRDGARGRPARDRAEGARRRHHVARCPGRCRSSSTTCSSTTATSPTTMRRPCSRRDAVDRGRPLGRHRRAHRQRQDDVLAPRAATRRTDRRRRPLGGVPIADIPMAELRRRVALVPQEVELFAGTIRDNVTLFDAADRRRRRCSDPARAVARSASTQLGRRRHRPRARAGGAGLSAGEAQLLALARVWMRDPDLLVFDEATARIDPETERQGRGGRRPTDGRAHDH